MLPIFQVDTKDKVLIDINDAATSSFLLALNEFDNATESFQSIFASSFCPLVYIMIITLIYKYFSKLIYFHIRDSHRDNFFFNGEKYFILNFLLIPYIWPNIQGL